LLASALLNWAATLLSTLALAQADAGLVSPLFTFNPAVTLLLAWTALGETPGLRQSIGVAVVLFGAYLLDVEEARTGLLAPVRVLLGRPGTLVAIIASTLWGATAVLEKLAIEQVTPPSGSLVALLGTVLLVVFLTPGVLRPSQPENPSPTRGIWQGLRPHARALFAAIVLAGVALLFGFTAIALGLVGYVTTLFKFSAIFTILWARWFLGEGQVRRRDIFGWNYILMPRLPGRSLADQEMKRRLPEPARQSIARALGATLAELHTLTWPCVGDYDLATETIQPFEQSYAEHVLARLRGALASCVRATARTTAADIAWVEHVIAQGQDALHEPIQPCFVHGDYQESNVLVEGSGEQWQVSGVFDPYPGFKDPESDLSRPLAAYLDERPALAQEFLCAYSKQQPLRPGWKERFLSTCSWTVWRCGSGPSGRRGSGGRNA
jgi:drug/metabolite transporter (DMT)-like permease